MLKEIDTVGISNSLICAIEYGDFTGLDETDIEHVKSFLDYYKDCTFEYGSEGIFTRCAITNLFADCVEVIIYKWEN